MNEPKDNAEESLIVPASADSVAPAPRVTLRSLRAATEIDAISRALAQTGWNRKRAAELLSISYRGLLYKIRQHNITPSTGAQLSPFAER
jgi:DNA-binding NtrC family response regulator